MSEKQLKWRLIRIALMAAVLSYGTYMMGRNQVMDDHIETMKRLVQAKRELYQCRAKQSLSAPPHRDNESKENLHADSKTK